MDGHPEICSPPELLLGECCDRLLQGFQLTLGEADSAEGALSRYLSNTRKVRRIVDQWMAEYCRQKGKQRWCEKSPANLAYLPLLRELFPEAQWICLYRHPLDCVRSWVEMASRAGATIHGVSRHGGSVVAAVVEQWCTGTERALAMEGLFPAQTVRIRYEHLVSAPAEELGRVWSFLGVRAIGGLCCTALSAKHHTGPGDFRAAAFTAVQRNRVGKGVELDLSGVSALLHRRMSGLLEVLGYGERVRQATAVNESNS